MPSPKVSLPVDFTIPYFNDTSIVATITDATIWGSNIIWTPTDSIAGPQSDSVQTTKLIEDTWFTALVTDNSNSCTWMDSILIMVDIPNFFAFAFINDTIDSDTSICEGTSVVLKAYAEGGSGNYSFEWRDIANNVLSTNNSITVSPESETMYYLYANDGVTIYKDSLTVGVNPLPEIEFYPADGVYVLGEPIEFTATGAEIYNWDYNKYITTDLSGESVIVAPLEDTKLFVNASDINLCFSRDSVNITVTTFNWFVPEAFTPNGDNQNDFLFVYGNGIKSIHFRVYNKWGQLVFETRGWNPAENKSEGWNGAFNGKKQHNQTFGWVLEIKDMSGKTYTKEGVVTLIQ
jgi:gliding motility-associated-like protein